VGKVVMYSTVSVDGFIADENDQPGPLFDWLSSGDVPLDETGQLTVSQASYDHTRAYWDQIGVTIVGRHEAQELAGDRTVEVAAGDVGGQVLAAGLVEEVAMDVAPVVLGSGKRYFGSVDAQHLLEDPDVVIQGNRVLHVRYRVRR
jgi:dihydrofolate reductase